MKALIITGGLVAIALGAIWAGIKLYGLVRKQQVARQLAEVRVEQAEATRDRARAAAQNEQLRSL